MKISNKNSFWPLWIFSFADMLVTVVSPGKLQKAKLQIDIRWGVTHKKEQQFIIAEHQTSMPIYATVSHTDF